MTNIKEIVDIQLLPGVDDVYIYNWFLKGMIDASVKHFEQQQRRLKELEAENKELKDELFPSKPTDYIEAK